MSLGLEQAESSTARKGGAVCTGDGQASTCTTFAGQVPWSSPDLRTGNRPSPEEGTAKARFKETQVHQRELRDCKTDWGPWSCITCARLLQVCFALSHVGCVNQLTPELAHR